MTDSQQSRGRAYTTAMPLAFRLVLASIGLWGADLAAQSLDPTALVRPSTSTEAINSMRQVAIEAFNSHCARCHAVVGMDGIKRLTPREIYTVLRRGQMQEPATGLDDGELHAIAETFGDPMAEQHRPPNGGAAQCTAPRPGGQPDADWRGFSPQPTNTRLVDATVTQADIKSATLKWAFAFPSTGFEHGADNPIAVVDGQVYVGNLNHWMYALDAQTGCATWTFEADTGIRSGATVDAGVVAFGDMRGNVYGVDAGTGALKWRQLVDPQSFGRITGTPLATHGQLFVPVSYLQEILGIAAERSCCTANGSAAAYDMLSGKPLWQTYMIDQSLQYHGKTAAGARQFGPSGAVIFAPPTWDAARGAVYVATGNQTTGPVVPQADAIVALDAKTGMKRWVTTLVPPESAGQDLYNFSCEDWVNPSLEGCPSRTAPPGAHGDRDISAPPILVRRPDGKEVLVIGSKSGVLYALDPDARGKILWQRRLSKGGELGGIEYGMATDGTLVYAPISDAEIELNTSDGSMNAVDLRTGKLIWRTAVPRDACKHKREVHCLNAIVSPPVVLGDAVIVGAMDGVLRAYDRRDGRVFWSYDAMRPYVGVNGLAGHGGGFGMGGVTVSGDMMFVATGVNSGAVGPNAASGVLLAFRLRAKPRPMRAAPANQ